MKKVQKQATLHKQTTHAHMHTYINVHVYVGIFKHDFAFVIFYILYPVEFDILYIKCFRFGIE